MGHSKPWAGILNWEKGEARWILTFMSASWLQLQCELQCQPLPLWLPCHNGQHLQTVNHNKPSHSSVASVRILSQQWKKNKLIYGACLFFKMFNISIKQSIITKEYFFIFNISNKKHKRYIQCLRKSDSIRRQIDLHEKQSNEHVSWILSKIHNYMLSHINDYAKKYYNTRNHSLKSELWKLFLMWH